MVVKLSEALHESHADKVGENITHHQAAGPHITHHHDCSCMTHATSSLADFNTPLRYYTSVT